MKYGAIIQDLAVRGHNWKFYDDNFRFLRQAHRSSLPWDRIHGELWLKSQAPLRKLQPTNYTVPNRTQADSVPKGYCFRFHKGRKCTPVVPTNIFVSNARGFTPLQNVIFVTSENPPVLSPKLPNPFPISLPTPVKVERLVFLLDGYTPSTVQYLLSGFTRGFPVHFQGDRQSFFATNLLSAVENPLVVDAKLQKELDAHRLAGPFQSPPPPLPPPPPPPPPIFPISGFTSRCSP